MKPQAITADQYEPRRMDDATFAAHDAALGAQIDAHRERAESIEALSQAVAYLAGLPVEGCTPPTGDRSPWYEDYTETAVRLVIIACRLAKAQRDIAAHNAAPQDLQTPPAWQDLPPCCDRRGNHLITDCAYEPSPLLRREILALDATDDEKAALLAADWPSQDEQPKTTVDTQAYALERLQALRAEHPPTCESCGSPAERNKDRESCSCRGCHCDPCRRARGENPDADPTCADCGEQYDMRPGSDICAACAKQYDERDPAR